MVRDNGWIKTRRGRGGGLSKDQTQPLPDTYLPLTPIYTALNHHLNIQQASAIDEPVLPGGCRGCAASPRSANRSFAHVRLLGMEMRVRSFAYGKCTPVFGLRSKDEDLQEF